MVGLIDDHIVLMALFAPDQALQNHHQIPICSMYGSALNLHL
jgi:hypothetical protein